MENKKILAIVIAIIALIGALAIEGALTMWLWNWIAVNMFGATPIDFWLGCGFSFVINLAVGLFRNND